MAHGTEKRNSGDSSSEASHVDKTDIDVKEAQTSHVEALEVVDVHKEIRMTKAKWLACIALCVSYTTAFQQNACTAAIVKHIDAELGPTTFYNWILSSYSISVSVMYPISGGLSDIFGRKWFFIGGTVISLIGTIIALAAQNVQMVIAGMVFKGVGAGSQQLALAAIAEIVPNRQRGVAQAVLDVVTFPWAIFGGLIGNAMVSHGGLTFRINFLVGVCLNLTTIVTIWFWYHPEPRPLPGNITKTARFFQLDWIGVTLMAIGIVLTLMGFAFGGTQFEWGSAGNVAPLTIGIVSLIALVIWEWKFAKHPFFAHELFIGKTRTFTLMMVVTFIGGMSLYTAMAFWTQQCQGMFFRDPIKIGVSAIPGGTGGAIGGFLGGILVGKHKFLRVPHMLFYANAIKLVSDAVFSTFTPNDYELALAMGFLAMFGMGMSLTVLIVGVQLSCEDKNLGLATLVLGSIRGIGGSVAITIYSSILQNTIAADAGPRIAKAVLPLGVPTTTLPKFIALLLGAREDLAGQLPGVSPDALAVGSETIKWSWAQGFSHIYYAAMAFSGLAVLCAFIIKDTTHNMTDNLAVQLTNEKVHADPKENAQADPKVV